MATILIKPLANAIDRRATAAWRGMIIVPWNQIGHIAAALNIMDERAAEGLAIATNEAAEQVRNDVIDAIAREVTLDRRHVADSVVVSGRATEAQPAAQVTVLDTPQPLDGFAVYQDDQGAFAAVYRDDAPRRIPDAFIGTMPSGNAGVFQRVDDAGRLPIQEQYGPSAADILRDRPGVLKRETEEASYTLVNAVLRTRDRILNEIISEGNTAGLSGAISRLPAIASAPFRAASFLAAIFRNTV